MPLRSAPYYWLECDNCGALAEYDDFSAWKDKASAIDRAEEWTQDGEKFHCPVCPPLDVDERERAETDCACPVGDDCPCEANGGDGLCACCRGPEGEHRGTCASPGLPEPAEAAS